MSDFGGIRARRRRVHARRRHLSAVVVTAAAVAVLMAALPIAGAADPATERLVTSTELLQFGHTGQMVSDLQTALLEVGVTPGPVDGIFGEMTSSAVLAFQIEAGIAADGIVGRETRAAINRTVGGSPPGTPQTPLSGGTATLSPGSSGFAVSDLQHELTRTGFYRGPIDGDFGPMTSSAVVAFHKVRGLDRSETWKSSDWGRIEGWYPRSPGYGSADFRVDVDLTRQVLFAIRNGAVAAVMPVSTGNGESYVNLSGQSITARTPRGDYTIFRSVDGWDVSYLGELYEPWYFYGGYAIHGSNFVPPYPASHGCIRVSIADSLWLDARMWPGMPVHVRD